MDILTRRSICARDRCGSTSRGGCPVDLARCTGILSAFDLDQCEVISIGIENP
jgi:hypothetical protein